MLKCAPNVRLYKINTVYYPMVFGDNPAEKNNRDQHQKTTYAGLADEKPLARPAYVVFWCWSLLFFFKQGR